MRTMKDPGTKLDLLIKNRLTSASRSWSLSPSILSYGERIRRQTQAQAVAHTKQATSALSSAQLPCNTLQHLATPCNTACLKLEDVLHVPSGY